MANNNVLTLAVAGSRKTQSIVDACASSPAEKRILILTYTQNNQHELRSRLASYAGNRSNIEVMGWFTFLIRYFVKPYLPYFFPGERLLGFDFNSEPMIGVATDNYSRYFTPSKQGRRPHLAQLAYEVEKRSGNQGSTRLARMYDSIYIDEVQDLCGWDLEVLKQVLKAETPVTMVGDVRQAILSTNPRERKNKQFMYMGIWNWFREQERTSLLKIEHRCETWRCGPGVASFADSLFGAAAGFGTTVSRNDVTTEHDGVFLVRQSDVDQYVETFKPLFLRNSAQTARNEPYHFLNIGLSKGLTSERVLIWPTAAMKGFAIHGATLTQSQAAHLYVAATRAEQSVAFVVGDNDEDSSLPIWTPAD